MCPWVPGAQTFSKKRSGKNQMDVRIRINHAVKKYGDFVAIPDLSVEIQPGEFFTLLGPSGCGKTTLLRMIAGFNSIEGGEFYFSDRLINDLDPAKRNIGMVFQNYAIFPHLTVRKNVAFGLKNRKLPPDRIKQKTEEFMALMKINEYADRLPEKLSGGQQQRVALARALAIEPEVLLMDEPLSNLDAKLRVEMRSVIKEIQNRLRITTVYVTHDQEEAMAVSDRIAVMNLGVIQQIGTPKALYQRPANKFVATFIGRTTFFDARIKKDKTMRAIVFDNGYTVSMPNLIDEVQDGQSVVVSIRPEELVIENSATVDHSNCLAGKVVYSTFLGLNTHYMVELEDGNRVEIIQESQIDDIIENGVEIKMTVNAEKINVFTSDDEKSLVK